MANNKHGAKYTRELLTEAVANSISIAGVLRFLEIPVAGGTHAHISRKLRQFGIDTSHFKRVAPNRGEAVRMAAHPGARLSCAPAWLATAEAARLTPSAAREWRAVRLRGMRHRGRVERRADSIARGSRQRGLAGQQEGEPSLSLPKLPLADSDILGQIKE